MLQMKQKEKNIGFVAYCIINLIYMDSLTQIVLGAAVGEAVLGRKVGKKAALWGAICATIPDLDIFVNPFVSELTGMCFHRSITHSFIFGVILGPIFGWLIYKKVYKEKQGSLSEWKWLAFWAFFTHPILDCFTNWGTQFFYPFSTYRVAFNSIFIVDGLYTIPFAICLIVALCLPMNSLARKRWNNAGLILSTTFLLFTLVNKASAGLAFKKMLHKQGSSVIRMTTQPMPFNVLWNCVAEEPSGYRMASYSLLSDYHDIVFRYIPKNHELADSFANPKTIEKLAWFSNGYYCLEQGGKDTLLWHDLRFGIMNHDTTGKPEYTFSAYLPNKVGADIHQIDPSVNFKNKDIKTELRHFWRQTWNLKE